MIIHVHFINLMHYFSSIKSIKCKVIGMHLLIHFTNISWTPNTCQFHTRCGGQEPSTKSYASCLTEFNTLSSIWTTFVKSVWNILRRPKQQLSIIALLLYTEGQNTAAVYMMVPNFKQNWNHIETLTLNGWLHAQGGNYLTFPSLGLLIYQFL